MTPNHSKNLYTLLSAATAFWKRHFFMPPQPIPALTTMQYPPSNFRGRSRRRQSAHFLAAGKPAPTHARGYFLALLFALCALLAPASAFAQSAGPTVTTDQSDYPPGGTVYITGAGFQPNETVTNQVLHADPNVPNDDATSPAHQPWTVTADENGNFSTTWDVPLDEDEGGATLQLTATGQTSELTAQATFTDATSAVNVTAATGGSAISADFAGGSYTNLTGPSIAEVNAGDIGTGTIILNAPAGFTFNNSVTVTPSVSSSGSAQPVVLASSTATVTT